MREAALVVLGVAFIGIPVSLALVLELSWLARIVGLTP